jgi:hypothetical protein
MRSTSGLSPVPGSAAACSSVLLSAASFTNLESLLNFHALLVGRQPSFWLQAGHAPEGLRQTFAPVTDQVDFDLPQVVHIVSNDGSPGLMNNLIVSPSAWIKRGCLCWSPRFRRITNWIHLSIKASFRYSVGKRCLLQVEASFYFTNPRQFYFAIFVQTSAELQERVLIFHFFWYTITEWVM